MSFAQNATVSGGTISLIQGNNDLVNNASGLTTISSTLNLIGPATTIDWGSNSSGTLAIAGPITVQTASNFFLYNGNYDINTGGSITFATSGALVLNDSANTTTNILQSGGLISVNRPNNNAMYLTQAGTTNYTITGGSAVIPAGVAAIGDGASGRAGFLTINVRCGRVGKFPPTTNLFGVSGTA